MRRREFLSEAAKATAETSLAAALSGTLPDWFRHAKHPVKAQLPMYRGKNSLRAHATARGLLAGFVVDGSTLKADATYAALVKEQANIITPATEMTWRRLRPTVDSFDFEPADEVIAFAETNRMRVRGRALCWHEQLPAWFAAEATRTNVRQLLSDHIDKLAGRYAGRMHSWDVVSEGIDVAGVRPDGLRASPWLRLLGEEYLELAFHVARQADPQALLTYNERQIEGEDAASQAQRAATTLLLRRLRARNVPVDAVGVESHLSVGDLYGDGLRRFLAEMRELGLQVFVTEMDVAAATADEKAVPGICGRYLDLMLGDANVTALVTRSLPFDTEGKPTGAFFAIRDAVDRRKNEVVF